MNKAKTLFLLDGIGAVFSTFFLGIILINFESTFGIPKRTLHLLASFPILFALFDFYAYFQIETKNALNLKIVASLNLSYCILSLCLAFSQIDVITSLGWIYFLAEITIILILVHFELKTAKRSKK